MATDVTKSLTRGRLLYAGLLGLAVLPHLNILPIDVHLGDDRLFVADNYLTTHPSLTNALRFFTEIHKDFYQPIPLLSYMIDYAIWGTRWAGFHLTSLAIHAVNVVLRKVTSLGKAPGTVGIEHI